MGYVSKSFFDFVFDSRTESETTPKRGMSNYDDEALVETQDY